MVVTPIGKQVPTVCVPTIVVVLQLSVAVGAAHCAMAHVSAVLRTIFAGQLVKIGLMVSLKHGFVFVTVTVKVQIAVLFRVSLPV
jgi:hypothetical protein